MRLTQRSFLILVFHASHLPIQRHLCRSRSVLPPCQHGKKVEVLDRMRPLFYSKKICLAPICVNLRRCALSLHWMICAPLWIRRSQLPKMNKRATHTFFGVCSTVYALLCIPTVYALRRLPASEVRAWSGPDLSIATGRAFTLKQHATTIWSRRTRHSPFSGGRLAADEGRPIYRQVPPFQFVLEYIY